MTLFDIVLYQILFSRQREELLIEQETRMEDEVVDEMESIESNEEGKEKL
jgi:hypothetical protein